MSDAKYEVASQTVEVLLSPGTVQFEVPAFQRKYAWGADEINQLIDDIFGETSKSDLPYFLGSIVLAAKEGADGNEPLLVLDGQQRLTTLSLIISVLIQKMKDSGSDEADENKMYLFSKKIKKQKQPKVLLQQDDFKVYEDILKNPNFCDDVKYKNTSIGVSTAKIALLISEYKDAYSENKSDAEAYENMLARLLYDVEIVRIKAPSEKDAFRLFETLNDRGLALSAADLIKNKLFSHCGNEIDDAFEAWSSMISLVRDDDVVNFLRYYWIATHGFSRKRGLYDIYKNHINTMDSTAATLFAIDLEEAAKDYQQIITPTPKTCTWGEDVAEVIDKINTYRARSCRPAIMACGRNHPSLIKKIVDMCESISVRYSLVGEKNPNYLERIYSEISKILRESVAPLEVISSSSILDEVPSDDEFRDKLISKNITSINPSWRELLVRLNEKYSTGETRIETSSRVHVEHILPQHPRATVLTESGLNKDEAENLINKLGNLTLLSGKRNKELSNKPFSNKKNIYKRSEIALTKELSKYEKWGEAAILDRSNQLANVAVEMFPHPMQLAKQE